MFESCVELRETCPFETAVDGRIPALDRDRYCTRCGRPLPEDAWSSLHGDVGQTRLAHRDDDPFPVYDLSKRLQSRLPLTLAGRHIVVVRDDRIEGLSVDDLGYYTEALHKDYLSFAFETRIKGGRPYTPVFAAPYLYWIADSRIERLNARTEHLGVDARSTETVVRSVPRPLVSAPAVARVGRTTHIVWPLRHRLAALILDAHNKVVSAHDDAELFDVGTSADGRWHTPVFDAKRNRWIAVDTTGTVQIIQAETSTSSPFDLVKTLDLLDDEVRVSSPVLVGRCLFAAYWSRPALGHGVCRLHLDTNEIDTTEVDLISPPNVELQQHPGLPPLAIGATGVLWPGARPSEVLFVAAHDDTEGQMLSVDPTHRFDHTHAFANDRRIVAWVPSDLERGSRIVEFTVDVDAGRLRGSIKATLTAPHESARSLRLVPRDAFHQPVILAQSDKTIRYLYPQRGSLRNTRNFQ